MTNTIEVLKAARELISKPERWTQGSYAESEDCGVEHPNSDKAVCFCSVGAIAKIMGISGCDAETSAAAQALEEVDDVLFDIVAFNDSHTHAEVLAAFDAAIAAETSI